MSGGPAGAPRPHPGAEAPLGVVHLTAEYWPFARTGGLGEAVSGLARFQAAAGVPTTVLLPLYRQVREAVPSLERSGPPLAVVARLILLCILVGVILHALGFDPGNIIESIRRMVQAVWDMGFDAVRWLWRYFLLGAIIVIPIWLILRFMRAPR